MLGERIRKRRKQKKMTLEALAGTELTKGMLSLIENNKAKPSMESLSYIAERLEVDLSDLLEEIDSGELRGILEQAEKIYNTIGLTDKYKQLIKIIDPYVSSLSQGYETARLLEIYSYSLYYEKKQDWQEPLNRAAKIYDQMNISSNRAFIGIFRSTIKFKEHDYSKSLEIILNERKEIEATHAYIDPLARLSLDYHEAILYFAVGDSQSATETIEKALTLSKEKRIFYLIDDLYRLAAAQAMTEQDHAKKQYYLTKLRQYGEFADHLSSLHFCELIEIITMIMEKQLYNEALTRIEQYLSNADKIHFHEPWFYLEKGKALYYLKYYEEALLTFNKVVIPENIHHPFDLSMFYVMDSYKALIQLELGQTIDAQTTIKKAVQNFEPLLETPFKQFNREAFRKINQTISN
ncbi:helix-turn-helix domain-containing protein [Sutcliffiella halmapala]|uniref:helix-turn-helix domain-containing protein n=1 Tax=Sutcliffiella halmapala TaxID=79882 RepID=UPI000995921F|nr:helix-turn-helix transcriptional regulator [Sutcliffiella halmapala]